MTFKESILASVPRHTQLLKSLKETSYASATALQTVAYISRIEGQIATETKKAEKLYWEVPKDRAEYETFRDSHIDGKLIGKSYSFAAKTEKEENVYNDVLESPVKEIRNLETLKANLESAQAKLPGLNEAAQLHKTYQCELTSFYDSLFSLPRPQFLTLDIATSLLARAQASHTAASKPFDTASQTVQLLSEAQKCLTLALNSITSALDSLRRDTELVLMMSSFNTSSIGVGTARNAMVTAQKHAGEAEGLLRRAKLLEPMLVQQIAATQAAQPDFLVSCGAAVDAGSQVRGGKRAQFNILKFKDRMDVAACDLKRAVAQCVREVNAVKERVGLLKGEVDDARERLEDAEVGVRKAMEEIFRRVVDGDDLGEDMGLGGGLFGEMTSLEPFPSYLT